MHCNGQIEDKFRGTGLGVNISVDGRPHLGAPLGTRTFAESFVRNKVQSWVNEVMHLSTVAKTQSQAAFAASWCHGKMDVSDETGAGDVQRSCSNP